MFLKDLHNLLFFLGHCVCVIKPHLKLLPEKFQLAHILFLTRNSGGQRFEGFDNG